MELPLGGPALRHYTQSRPRPHRQKLNYRPSRPQETIIESENEVLELMGRVDEGVEEFFTKRVLPSDTLKRQDDESITVHEVAPASSVPCPPPTKTLRRKLGDFFTLKKKRGLKSEASHEGRPKKTSIADLIRPLREVARAEKEKDKDRVKEHDKENEKEKVKEQPSGVSGESAVQETPVPSALPLRGEAVPPRRALREGKSQSLILLSGSAAAGTTNARNNSKKQFEGQHSFEQKLHLMLQRIGVSKPQPGETQNQEGEMKKAESEGTIIDSKPEPPPTFSKPRTMSASADTRHQIRPSVSAHESAGKPALLPKPVLKPGPPPTTSGRNTPENELTQIQEAETHTPTKPSPTAVPSPPPPATTAPTVSNSIPDSASVCPSSTVTASDTEICTDSVDPAAAATTPTNATELDSKTSVLETTTTELPTSTFPTTTTSSTTPPEPPATASVTSTSSESINPSLPVTSSSATISTPSITTLETASAPGDESSVATASTNMSTELTLPEPNVILSVDAGPADGGVAAISATSPSPSTTISSMPTSGLSTTTDSVTEASDGSLISTSAVTPDSSVTKTASPSDTITALPDTTMTTSSTLPSTTTMSSVSQSATLIPADISAPSTSSSETTPTDTTPTISRSTRTDNTYTTSSATTAAISSPLATDSDPPHINNVSTTIAIPTISSLPDNSTAASQHLTSPVPSSDNTVQDNELQTSPGGRSSVEPAEKATADKVEIVQTEMGENKDDGRKKSKDDNEKPTEVNSKETRKEAQEESVKTEEDTTTAPPSGIESVRCSDEEAIESLKQQQDKSVSEK